MKCDGCKSEINVVPVKVVWVSPNFDKHPLRFDYCPECIKSDLQKGFVVTDLKGDEYVFEPEKFYLDDTNTRTSN